MIGLIDADHIMYLICWNKKDETLKSLEDCYSAVDSYVLKLVNTLDLTSIHLFLTIGRGFRYRLYPKYKANRINNVKPEFFKEVRNYLIEKYNAIYLEDNLEADDLVNIYKTHYINTNQKYCIISPDKDVKNLCGYHFYIKENVINIISTSHEQEYFWKSMIIGDTGDNIKGIPKKGIVFADKLYEECLDKSNEERTFELFREKILTEYIKYFEVQEGIEEFYLNYKMLKILDKYEGIKFQEPVKIKDIYARTIGVVGQ